MSPPFSPRWREGTSPPGRCLAGKRSEERGARAPGPDPFLGLGISPGRVVRLPRARRRRLLRAASSDPCRGCPAAAQRTAPRPGRLGEGKGLRPRAPSPGSSRWRVRASGWGCGGDEGGGEARGGREGGASVQPAGGRWLAVGQLKKSRRGVPPNLSKLRARAEGRSGVTAAAGRRKRWPDGDCLSLLGLRARRTEAATGADSGGNRALPCATGAAPRASATAGRSDRQSQVARTARRVPALPAGDRRRPPRSARAAARPVVLPASAPRPRGTNFPQSRSQPLDQTCRASPPPGAVRAERALLGRDVGAQRRQRQGEGQEGPRLREEACARGGRPEPR